MGKVFSNNYCAAVIMYIIPYSLEFSRNIKLINNVSGHVYGKKKKRETVR